MIFEIASKVEIAFACLGHFYPPRWATSTPGVMGATYDGIYWDPPAGEAYQWWVRVWC